MLFAFLRSERELSLTDARTVTIDVGVAEGNQMINSLLVIYSPRVIRVSETST